MVKIVGKIKTIKKVNAPMYMVRRKNRTNSLDCIILHEFGKSLYTDCSRTCTILNDSNDNININGKKNFSSKINFYSPALKS